MSLVLNFIIDCSLRVIVSDDAKSHRREYVNVHDELILSIFLLNYRNMKHKTKYELTTEYVEFIKYDTVMPLRAKSTNIETWLTVIKA